VRLRLTNPRYHPCEQPFLDFDHIMAQRIQEADEFYCELQPHTLTDDERLVQRQAFAGMLWSKQYYFYDVADWLDGDPTQPPPPPERRDGRNGEWIHLNNMDVLSMPDKWEYPWYAAWDLAFHCITLALLEFESGTLAVTEAGTKRRASLHLVEGAAALQALLDARQEERARAHQDD